MESGKTGKYLKHAVAEIILVVIGILIAVQIKNWNESNITKKNEFVLVKQLLEDAKTDSTFFASRISLLSGQEEFYNELFDYCEGEISESNVRNKISRTEQPFIQLIYQSNLIHNNPDAYISLSDIS